MARRRRIIKALLLLLFLSSCAGYRLGSGSDVAKYHTLSLGKIEGERKGDLELLLAQEAAHSLPLSYLSCGGNLVLHVNVKKTRVESNGFRYAVNKEGQRLSNTVATEDFLQVMAEVHLIDALSGASVAGPLSISAAVSYDFQPDASNADLVQTSYGQLDFRDAARDAAYIPLYRLLCRKIMDRLAVLW